MEIEKSIAAPEYHAMAAGLVGGLKDRKGDWWKAALETPWRVKNEPALLETSPLQYQTG